MTTYLIPLFSGYFCMQQMWSIQKVYAFLNFRYTKDPKPRLHYVRIYKIPRVGLSEF